MEEIDKKLDDALSTPETGYLSMSFEAKIRRKLALNAVLAEQRSSFLVYIIAGLVMAPALVICLALMSPDALASQVKIGGLVLVAFGVVVAFSFAESYWSKKELARKSV
jgi:uncharacterized membrane protein YbhN (UPF0104 family)